MPLSVYFPPQYLRTANTSIHDILVGVTLRQFIGVSDHFVHDLCGASCLDVAAPRTPKPRPHEMSVPLAAWSVIADAHAAATSSRGRKEFPTETWRTIMSHTRTSKLNALLIRILGVSVYTCYIHWYVYSHTRQSR